MVDWWAFKSLGLLILSGRLSKPILGESPGKKRTGVSIPVHKRALARPKDNRKPQRSGDGTGQQGPRQTASYQGTSRGLLATSCLISGFTHFTKAVTKLRSGARLPEKVQDTQVSLNSR